jgi:pimeloyl-ACP methyl ester carboxylesterase
MSSSLRGGTDNIWWNRRVNPDLRLSARALGEAGPRVVFVHGLFGQGRNWTTIAKGLAGDHRVTLLDLPNHGHSPWTDRVDYVEMAQRLGDDLERFGEQVTLVGHSMGGKVAMQLALRRPELLRALVVVDIAPVEYPLTGGRTDDPHEEQSPFAAYIAAMQGIDLGTLATRTEADEALRDVVPSRMVRGFLLQNLEREGTAGWRWRLNLEVLCRDLDRLRGFPEPPPGARYDGPVLWIAGANSHYVLDRDRDRMQELFPGTRLVRVKNAGHWVHSEQPDIFLATLQRFLSAVEDGA